MPAKKNEALFMFFWLPVLVWMGAIFSASCLPGTAIPRLFSYEDIVFHLGVYAILAYLFSRAIQYTCLSMRTVTVIFIAIAFGTIYGVTDEFHQSFVPHRDASFFDVSIDGAGSVLGSLIYPAAAFFARGAAKAKLPA